jgi:hypothetical protein
MKSPIACLLSLIALSAHAQSEIPLDTPHTVNLNPIVSVFRCSASLATTGGYETVVTGFSADGNYVLGQAPSWFTCGSAGRGGTLYSVALCTFLTWDLSGNLVSVNTPSNGHQSQACPAVSLVFPSRTPPGTTVVGNEFANTGGYTAETLIAEACGSIACYASYNYPTLVTP